MMEEAKKEYLRNLFTDLNIPGSFGGVNALIKAVRRDGRFDISRKDIKNWLKSSETYTLHKPVFRKFNRNRVVVGGINIEYDADLADMSLLSEYNRGYSYFLVVIDDFSKKVHTESLKTKTGKEVTNAMKSILENVDKIPDIIRTDQGTEFSSRIFQNLLNRNRIRHWVTQNELKANIAERCIKTLKNKIYQYFTYSQQLNWIDILPTVTDTYNRSYHRSIKEAPDDVALEQEDEIWNRLYPPKALGDEAAKFKFNINDKVRILPTRRPFDREYDIKWTVEYFIVTDRYFKENIPKYKLKDYLNEPIKGSFYENELQKIVIDDNTVFRIERILGRRTRRGIREVLVKWFGWGDKFNSYIPAADLQNYQR